MAKQNIFDNETFFEGYQKLREKKSSANVLFEIPALYSLLPDLKGKKIICVVNLAPHNFRGIESEGMLLCSETDGVPKAVFVDADVPAGSEVH